jgi:hypothetical protein
MSEVAKFSAVHMLRDGRQVEIRAIRPEDRDGFVEAVSRASDDSLRRRFFAIRRNFSEQQLEFFSLVDFSSRVALTVLAEENGRPGIVGGGRYVMLDAGPSRGGLRLDRRISGPRHRYGIDAASQFHCPRGGTAGIDRRGITRKCRDARRFQEERFAPDN